MGLKQNMIKTQANLQNYIEYKGFIQENELEEENQQQLQKSKIMIMFGNIMGILKMKKELVKLKYF